MENGSDKLIKLLKLDKGKPNFQRRFNFKLYPFFTRNPERAKFSNGFSSVLGALSRHSLGLKVDYSHKDFQIENIYKNVEVVNDFDEPQKYEFLERIFGFNQIKSIKHPYILNYYPLSMNKESRGEIDISFFICRIFNLYQNENWHQFVGNKTSKNLVEQILLESIDEIPSDFEENPFVTILQNLFEERQNDLDFLLKHKDFALKNLDKFFAFYYFQYIIQTTLNLEYINNLKDGTKMYP
ncbi:DNA phosphorothioation-dependent restriction protein DptG, partial [Staphylococcus pasteuri]|uniref:DNA phosphorothioation-dependent restriction protein DptG n=1 Tax=Staphylococcus pasteuri TaxID=45972 RepID=UPI000D38F83B